MTIDPSILSGGLILVAVVGGFLLAIAIAVAPLFIVKYTRKTSEEMKRVRELLERQANRESVEPHQKAHKLGLR
jgi:uncharacterized protein YoxC